MGTNFLCKFCSVTKLFSRKIQGRPRVEMTNLQHFCETLCREVLSGDFHIVEIGALDNTEGYNVTLEYAITREKESVQIIICQNQNYQVRYRNINNYFSRLNIRSIFNRFPLI